jgi:hypothetical protein
VVWRCRRRRSPSYPPPQGREKGVDAQLAVDLVAGATDDDYDLAVLASADSDLLVGCTYSIFLQITQI